MVEELDPAVYEAWKADAAMVLLQEPPQAVAKADTVPESAMRLNPGLRATVKPTDLRCVVCGVFALTWRAECGPRIAHNRQHSRSRARRLARGLLVLLFRFAHAAAQPLAETRPVCAPRRPIQGEGPNG